MSLCLAIDQGTHASQRSNAVCWDRRDGRPLSPIFSWQARILLRRGLMEQATGVRVV